MLKDYCMKKFFIVILSVFFVLSFSSCAKNQGLTPYVSELRSALFEGQSQYLTIKAGYGFRETPFNQDGQVKSRVNLLTFKLLNEQLQATYTISFNFNGKAYSSAFKLNPVSHSLTAEVEIDDFNLKEFNVTISNGVDNQTITMRSIIPENTMDYKTALSKIEKSQPELIKAFCDQDGNFNAEIHLRIIVKDGKSYWFVGLNQPERLKAFLVDGTSGKVLAVRDTF